MNIMELKKHITEFYENSELLKNPHSRSLINQGLRMLEEGKLRIATPPNADPDCGNVEMTGNLLEWNVHSWVKYIILLAMKIRPARPSEIVSLSDSEKDRLVEGRLKNTSISFCDKFDLQSHFEKKGVRVVPQGVVREGCHLEKGVIVMPAFINLGAWVGENTMVDTWATVGSCAQIGKNVHLSGGVGIGGVLEPAQARPVLIGDNAFIGSRAIIVEGAVVSQSAVIAANVCLTSSTPIYDVTNSEKKEYRGFVPPYAVVVPGTRAKQFPGGKVQLNCSYIISYRSQSTDSKVSLNETLRETGIAV